ncbi:MAG: ATP synthase F1 subunit gamma [Paludibacteraceae bacterium]|nr:ATP synthase F1 subunit gamma [Paludibacteraceae bacterium]
MPSLKEVRARIASVTSTSKITSAMKLVSAAKLRRAQDAIASFLPYQEKLGEMLTNYVASSTEALSVPLAQVRDVRRIAVVAVSSNSSLCGAFNSNVIKAAQKAIAQYSDLDKKDVLVYPVGKKMTAALAKAGYVAAKNFDDLVDSPDYDKTGALVDELIALFCEKQVDRVLLIYNHFKNAAQQQVRTEQFLPVTASADTKAPKLDYILEPDRNRVIQELVPRVVRLQLYGAILDSIAAEHGARTTAMQIATDNAQDLIQELTLKYNKARQAAITNELIDIVSGSEGLKS